MTITATRVVLSRAQAEWMTARMLKLERLSKDLRARWQAEHETLLTALHELAIERGSKDPRAFIQAWLKKHRTPDQHEGLPRKKREPQFPQDHSAQSKPGRR